MNENGGIKCANQSPARRARNNKTRFRDDVDTGTSQRTRRRFTYFNFLTTELYTVAVSARACVNVVDAARAKINVNSLRCASSYLSPSLVRLLFAFLPLTRSRRCRLRANLHPSPGALPSLTPLQVRPLYDEPEAYTVFITVNVIFIKTSFPPQSLPSRQPYFARRCVISTAPTLASKAIQITKGAQRLQFDRQCKPIQNCVHFPCVFSS